ncbi:hypothetical protein BH10ACI2_BH10ACI2_17410 [soil metagenome]
MFSQRQSISAAIVTTFFFVGVASGQKIRAVSAPELANVLSITKTSPSPSLKVEPIPGLERTSLVTNRAKTRKAYVLCVPDKKGAGGCDSFVFVTDIASKTVYVIMGEPDKIEHYRPIDELKWLTNDTVSYERWTGPHFGHRYVVNIKTKKQIAAYILTG